MGKAHIAVACAIMRGVTSKAVCMRMADVPKRAGRP